jgi:DNA-binding transcriptional MerR regulator
MRIYTLTECCALFEVNAKTFRKWLEREGMQPQRSRADTRIRYLTREQVEHLAEVYGCALPPDEEAVLKDEHTSDLAALLAERLDQQERRLEHLEREMRQTQASMALLQQPLPEPLREPARTNKSQQIRQPEQREGSSEHRPMPKARTKTKSKKGGKGLPRTLVLLRVFAEQHHVPLKAADRASKAGKIAVVRGRWLVNSRYATQALGTRGQHDFYTLFKEHAGFTRCDRCPHHLAPAQ